MTWVRGVFIVVLLRGSLQCLDIAHLAEGRRHSGPKGPTNEGSPGTTRVDGARTKRRVSRTEPSTVSLDANVLKWARRPRLFAGSGGRLRALPRGAPAALAGPGGAALWFRRWPKGGPASREAGDVDRETCLGSPTFTTSPPTAPSAYSSAATCGDASSNSTGRPIENWRRPIDTRASAGPGAVTRSETMMAFMRERLPGLEPVTGGCLDLRTRGATRQSGGLSGEAGADAV
jgi:hypothetical protein